MDHLSPRRHEGNGHDHDRERDPCAVNSLMETPDCSPVEGRVVWDPAHSLWNGGMTLAALVLGPLTVRWDAVAVFLLTTGAALLLGHSVGFHRRLIHRSFRCPRWLEAVLVWIGTAVGMSGPFWMIRAHDVRDWAQRRPDCHPALRSGAPILTDYLWTVHGKLILERPPAFRFPPEIAANRFYLWLDRTWMLQQLPIAALLYLVGGWAWVVWGVCARVSVSVTGHWFIGRLAHTRGPQTWLVRDAGVQAYDVPWAAIPTMGEAWHNNHHAYPGSARLGLYKGQADWGFRFIQLLQRLGLAWDIQTPETLTARRDKLVAAPETPPCDCPVAALGRTLAGRPS